MKNKFFLLSTIISSCLFTIAYNQSTAQDLHPNMPTSGGGGKQRCYPASKCTGDPNLIGGNRGCAGNPYPAGGQYSGGNPNPGINPYAGGSQYAGGNQFSGGNQPGYGFNNPGNPAGAPSQKVLQTESTEKFSGVVKSVNRVPLPNESQIQIVLSTDQGDILVIVGPASFIDAAKVKLQAGDKVTVTGYRINANGNVVIVAAQIQRNGNTLQLLDENRAPLWGSSPGMKGGDSQPRGSRGPGYSQQGPQFYGPQGYGMQG